MSHVLDIDGISEKLLLLEHLVEGSEAYCSKRLIGSEYDQGDEQYDNYWGWIKGIACAYMIECAVKFRILQDTIKGEEDIIRFDDLDSKACKGLDIGKIISGNFKISLRETCNKIIHARHVTPKLITKNSNNTEFKFWCGIIDLRGFKNSEQWELQLNLGIWPQAMQRFIDEFSISDSAFYMGQDWY